MYLDNNIQDINNVKHIYTIAIATCTLYLDSHFYLFNITAYLHFIRNARLKSIRSSE